MIQRIQTVFLLIISIVVTLGYFLLSPIDFMGFAILNPFILKTYFVLTLGLSLFALFLFKRRKTQLIINRFHYFFQIITALVFIYGISNYNDLKALLPWLAMPILILILLLLSNNAIKKDEDLIRSIDRLR